MAYDLLIKNGRIVDGSGMPAFRGDVGVENGKIVEMGKLERPGEAARSMPRDEVVAPGFVDNHYHFDAQVTWDPLCSFSPQHGATTVVFGNCSLGLAPITARHREARRRVSLVRRSDPDERARHGRRRVGVDRAIHEPARRTSRRQRRQFHRPHDGALLRDGRREPRSAPPPTTRSRRCRTSCATA